MRWGNSWQISDLLFLAMAAPEGKETAVPAKRRLVSMAKPVLRHLMSVLPEMIKNQGGRLCQLFHSDCAFLSACTFV